MKQIREVLLTIVSALESSGFSSPKRQAEDLLCDFLHFSRADIYQKAHQIIDEEKFKVLKEWMARRLQGEPLAYISGSVQFYGCDLKLTPHVLIPRPETEVLVDKIVRELKEEDLEDKILWDICCGSGCIGIAIKKKFPNLTVYSSDLSQDALNLAIANARKNQVEIHFLKGDLLLPFQGKKAHFIVCNPPYISAKEYLELDEEVKNYEPYLALVGGDSGLEVYERLAKELPTYLFPQAKVWLEIGYQQGEKIQKLFQQGTWKNWRLENDWAGHNRFFFLENE